MSERSRTHGPFEMMFIGYSGEGDDELLMFGAIGPIPVLYAFIPVKKFDFLKTTVREGDKTPYHFWFLEVTGGLARLKRDGVELYNIMG